MSLTGRTAIVTGASSGIGAAVARSLSQAGMRLLLTARRADRLDALVSQLEGALSLPGDLTDPELPQRLLDRATEAFGRCDAVVSNAGILEVGPIPDIDLDRMCRMVRVNVEAVYRLAYTALRHFQRQGEGHLVQISSVLGTKVRPSAGAYSGTKHAVEALSEALRLELSGTAIKISVVAPGLVMTELHEHMAVHPKDTLGISMPLRPDDVARSVRYVLEQPENVRIGRILVLPAESPI